MTATRETYHNLTIDIGGVPIRVRTSADEFARLLTDRYAEFVVCQKPASNPCNPIAAAERMLDASGAVAPVAFELDVDLVPAGLVSDCEEVSVRREHGQWILERGDFRAEWNPETRRGWVRQTANPYSIDGVLRILHSLILARMGGFLVHGASAVRNGRAFVFAGVSGTGKTTISRLAPRDVTLLTDEISYVREVKVPGARCQVSEIVGQDTGDRAQKPESLIPDTCHPPPAYSAFGTPFAGELARIGEKVQAPLATLFLLQQGPENRVEPVSEGQAVRELMRHILFFAHDDELVGKVFESVCAFVRRVPVERLVFTPDPRVWELIQ